MDVREKVMQRPSLGHFPEVNLPNSTLQFFADFGPDLCRMWHPIHQSLSPSGPIAHREFETAEILQGLRPPLNQPLEMDFGTNTLAQQQFMGSHIGTAGPSFNEPTLLQPQEWLGLYGGIGNWLMVDWDQSLGW
jgi:hypothetical protein